MIKQACCVFILTLGLLGCDTSKRVLPTMIVPQQFPSMTNDFKNLNTLPYTAWWQQFQDAELNHLMVCGLKRNMDIHRAFGHLEQAKGELQQVKLSWIPLVTLYGGYSTNPALGIPGGFYGMWPYYTLNIVKLIHEQKQAQWNVAYHQAAIDSARLTVIGQIASAYFTLIAQKEQLRLLKQLDDDLNKLITLSRKDIQIGLENEIDLETLMVKERLVLAEMNPVEHNMVVSENALRYLVNLNPGSIAPQGDFARIDFGKIKPSGLPATVLKNRPDLKMAEYAVNRASIGIKVAYSDFFPMLQLDDFIGEAHLPRVCEQI